MTLTKKNATLLLAVLFILYYIELRPSSNYSHCLSILSYIVMGIKGCKITLSLLIYSVNEVTKNTVPDIYLLLTDLEVCTVSYGPMFDSFRL